MKKRLRDAADFGRVLNVLADELVQASFHWQLRTALNGHVREYWREFSQSGTFWGLTVHAHGEVTLLHLCKAYDPYLRSINLGTFLASIKAYPEFFSEACFRERLKDNPHVDSLAASDRRPDMRQVEADIAFVSATSNPVVKNLIAWRNQLYAHRDPTKILAGKKLADEFPLALSDIDGLLDEGMNIVNRWSILFGALTHGRMLVGHDDFMFLLKAARAQIAAYDRQIEEDLTRANEVTATPGPAAEA